MSKIGAHHQLGDAARWSEGQSIVSPFLTEIEIGRKVLWSEESVSALCSVCCFVCCCVASVDVCVSEENHRTSDGDEWMVVVVVVAIWWDRMADRMADKGDNGEAGEKWQKEKDRKLESG